MEQFKTLIDSPDKLNLGETYYKVNKTLEYGSSVIKVKIDSLPYVNKYTGSLYVKCVTYYGTSLYKNQFSLLDYNVVPNTYNKHAIFSSLIEANEYADLPLYEEAAERLLTMMTYSVPYEAMQIRNISNTLMHIKHILNHSRSNTFLKWGISIEMVNTILIYLNNNFNELLKEVKYQINIEEVNKLL